MEFSQGAIEALVPPQLQRIRADKLNKWKAKWKQSVNELSKMVDKKSRPANAETSVDKSSNGHG